MLFQLTDAAVTAISNASSPIVLESYKLGDDFGYVPSSSDTDIHGSEVYTNVPSLPIVESPNLVKYTFYLDNTLGPFDFGEVGLYMSGGVLFALAANSTLIPKFANGVTPGNTIRIDAYLSMVGSNYVMFLDMAETNSTIKAAVIESVDHLPQPHETIPNLYVITSESSNQSSILAFTDRTGLWDFDAYAYANTFIGTVTDATTTGIEVADINEANMAYPQYLGHKFIQFIDGPLRGTCRYVASVSGVNINFTSPTTEVANIGDTFRVHSRSALSNSNIILPIATTTDLGCVIVGMGLTVDVLGNLEIDPELVTLSVNGKFPDSDGEVTIVAGDIGGFATVATSGSYTDLINIPPSFPPAAHVHNASDINAGTLNPARLPIATASTLGGVIPSADFTINLSGILSLSSGTLVTSFNSRTGNVTLEDTDVYAVTVGLINPTQIPDTDDVDDYLVPGVFYVESSDAASVANLPVAKPGVLTVNKSDSVQGVTQEYRVSSVGDVGEVYTRNYDGTFSSWINFITTGSIALPLATYASTGVVQVGTGLAVDGSGIISNSGLLTTDLGIDVAELENQPVDPGNITPSEWYTIRRLPTRRLPIGGWVSAGTWNADTNTPTLLANGMMEVSTPYSPPNDVINVDADGRVFRVTTAGTTSIDGFDAWLVNDLIASVDGKWIKVPVMSSPTIDPGALPTATTGAKGVVQIGTGIDVAAGLISVDPNYINEVVIDPYSYMTAEAL